jgi:hypothetical protein
MPLEEPGAHGDKSKFSEQHRLCELKGAEKQLVHHLTLPSVRQLPLPHGHQRAGTHYRLLANLDWRNIAQRFRTDFIAFAAQRGQEFKSWPVGEADLCLQMPSVPFTLSPAPSLHVLEAKI